MTFAALGHAEVVCLLLCWSFCCLFPSAELPGQCCTSKLAFPQELNKRLTVQVSSFLHHLCKVIGPLLAGQPDATTSLSCHRTAGGLSLHVKSELSGLPFYWDFHCCPAPVEMVSEAAESLGRGMAKIKGCLLMHGGFWVVLGCAGGSRVPGSACCPSHRITEWFGKGP